MRSFFVHISNEKIDFIFIQEKMCQVFMDEVVAPTVLRGYDS
jgi:hypothetical protein